MMSLDRPSNYPPMPVQHRTPRLPLLQPARVYSLVATLLPDGHGRQRPVLGLRRHLPLHDQLRRGQAVAWNQQKLVRPFVLRAALGERIQLQVTNLLPDSLLNLGLVDDDYAIAESDSAAVVAPSAAHTYRWNCRHAGVYPVYNRAASDPAERRNLLGVLIIEP